MGGESVNPSLMASHLVTDAHEHLAHILDGLLQASESGNALVAGFVVGIRALWVEIPPVARCRGERLTGFQEGIVGRRILIAQRGAACAVKM